MASISMGSGNRVWHECVNLLLNNFRTLCFVLGSAACVALAGCEAQSGGHSSAVARPAPEPEPSGATEPTRLQPQAAPAEAAPSSSSTAVTRDIDLVPLLGPGGEPLPQTEERPSSEGPRLLARLQRVVDALETGEPELAKLAFFPLVAYEQVKAIQDPRRDYEKRLLSAFFRDLAALAKRFGKDAKKLRLVGIELPAAGVEWIARGKEGNRIGYYRVKRSSLKLSVDAAPISIPIVSMISWRGEWYIVHLSGYE